MLKIKCIFRKLKVNEWKGFAMHMKPKENSDGKVGIRQTVIQGIK